MAEEGCFDLARIRHFPNLRSCRLLRAKDRTVSRESELDRWVVSFFKLHGVLKRGILKETTAQRTSSAGKSIRGRSGNTMMETNWKVSGTSVGIFTIALTPVTSRLFSPVLHDSRRSDDPCHGSRFVFGNEASSVSDNSGERLFTCSAIDVSEGIK